MFVIVTDPGVTPEASLAGANVVVHPAQSRRLKILRQAGGGFLAILGFILSPLSWWNDLLVNIPLAYIFAAPFSWVSPKLFTPAFVVGYLLTNVLGFVLMHHGLRHVLADLKKTSVRRELKRDLLWSLLYTALIIALVLLGWVKPPQEYFGG